MLSLDDCPREHAAKVEQRQADASTKATAKAKATPKTAATRNRKGPTKSACPKKDDTMKAAVQSPSYGTVHFDSPVYGKYKMFSNADCSYVQWKSVMHDKPIWKAILCTAAPNHHWACRYLQDNLETLSSKEAIADVVTKLKAGALNVGSDYLDGEDIG